MTKSKPKTKKGTDFNEWVYPFMDLGGGASSPLPMPEKQGEGS